MTEPTTNSALQEHDIDQIVRDIGIPPCPAILSRSSAEMQREEADMRKLAELIARDMALSAASISTKPIPTRCFAIAACR